jgi:hypothetical protein
MFHVEHFSSPGQNARQRSFSERFKNRDGSLEGGPHFPIFVPRGTIGCGKSGSILRQIAVSEAE